MYKYIHVYILYIHTRFFYKPKTRTSHRAFHTIYLHTTNSHSITVIIQLSNSPQFSTPTPTRIVTFDPETLRHIK